MHRQLYRDRFDHVSKGRSALLQSGIVRFPITDWLHVLNAEKGNIRYINEVMSVYRYHRGAYSGLSESQDLHIPFVSALRREVENIVTSGAQGGIFNISWIGQTARQRGEQASPCVSSVG